MKIKTKFTTPTTATTQDIFESILHARHITAKSKSTYLNPPPPTLKLLTSELKLSSTNLQTTAKLVHHHLNQNHDILVYGDYDADGITATAILYQTLTALASTTSARILPFIPDRHRHGYGISPQSLTDIFDGTAFAESSYSNFTPSLIITVDTGIVAHSQIQTLRDKNIDVIVTDHHQPTSTLPPANYIIHSLESSGSVVAWTLALAISASNSQTLALIDIATIGLVADQLPLTGINRTLAKHGLKALTQTKNLGIQQLLQLAGRKQEVISTYDISFALAPRLNATGRLTHALTALRLLCSHNLTLVKKLALEINQLNQQRVDLTTSATQDALNHPPEHKLIIASSPDYHEGIVGLVASRLVETYHRPALAISVGKDMSKGSARSLGEIDITQLLRHFDSDFEGLGGHKLASGFSLKTNKLTSLTQKLYQYADQNIADSAIEPSYLVETELSLDQLSFELAKQLQQLAPFGLGNSQPKFLTQNLTVKLDKPLGSEGQHRRLTLEQNGLTCEAIWFNCDISQTITSINQLIYTLNINTWRDRQSLQLIVKHAIL